MKKVLILPICIAVLLISVSHAQNTFPATGSAGIGTISPSLSSLLDISSTNKGFLAPRMTLAQRNLIPSPATGLLIYQTNSTPGFYYYTGGGWKAITPKAGWLLGGNTGTNPATNFLGTTDVQPLVFRVNNVNAGFLSFNGNIFWGRGSGNSNSQGFSNVAIGVDALYKNTDRNNLVAIGDSALHNNGIGAVNPFEATYNTAIGTKALFSNTTGFSNTAIGASTLTFNTTGAYNTAVGASTLYYNSTGTENTANGADALFYNTTGYSNTAIGAHALHHNTTGYYNTANGREALLSNQTGYDNTANGARALRQNTIGNYNTANGSLALYLNTTGYSNSANGMSALYGNTTGYQNTANGTLALAGNTTGANNTANGMQALGTNSSGNNNTANGFKALYNNTTGNDNTAGGLQSLYSNTTGFYNTAIGESALTNNTTGAYNTGVGLLADVNSGGYNYSSAFGVGATITGSNQIRIGSVGSLAGYDPVSIGGKVGWSTLSDGRVKKNMKANVPGLDFINKLIPITYNIDADAVEKIVQRPAIKDKDGKKIQPTKNELESTNSDNAIVYTGFVAQDVEKAAKSLNYEFSGVDAAKNDKDLYALRYSDFVVPLVRAVQELSAKNDDLQKQIDELKAMLLLSQSKVNGQQSTAISTASLEQNIPNPFTSSTRINYNMPQKFTTAQIVITDISGKALKTVKVSGSGRGSVNVDAAILASGAYQYSLMIDGKLAATKQMILIR